MMEQLYIAHNSFFTVHSWTIQTLSCYIFLCRTYAHRHGCKPISVTERGSFFRFLSPWHVHFCYDAVSFRCYIKSMLFGSEATLILRHTECCPNLSTSSDGNIWPINSCCMHKRQISCLFEARINAHCQKTSWKLLSPVFLKSVPHSPLTLRWHRAPENLCNQRFYMYR
jgi:hypothetical protein